MNMKVVAAACAFAVAIIVLLAVSATAQAHYYVESYTRQVAYDASRPNCGNGWAWWCNWYNLYYDGVGGSSHSRYYHAVWGEQSGWTTRTCQANMRVEHGWLASYNEFCW